MGCAAADGTNIGGGAVSSADANAGKNAGSAGADV